LCELVPPQAASGASLAVRDAMAVSHGGVGHGITLHIASDIDELVDARCMLVVGAGYQASPAILATAARYTKRRFLIADDWFDFNSAPDLTRPNVSVLVFEADQASFLAGYVAAGVSPNHVVGAYGSRNIPTVDLALDGFLAGARAWGQDSRTRVRILGWNGARGPFVGNDFDRAKAFAITSHLIRGGAHVIFGAAGDATVGSAAAAAHHHGVYVIGMYVDEHQRAPQFANEWLTSVVLEMRSPMAAALKRAASGGFAGGLYVGTLANGGVRLAPFHDLTRLVPGRLLSELSSVRRGLEAGWISTDPADYVPHEEEHGGNG
jgi:basic membrane protein A